MERRTDMDTFKGYMIPGICFESDYCICFYRWRESPLVAKQLTELWVIMPDDRRACFVDRGEGVDLFRKYHDFDEVEASEIDVEESQNSLKITVHEKEKEIFQAEITIKLTFGNRLVNFLLKRTGGASTFRKGKTETGREFVNKPERIITISDTRAVFNGNDLGKTVRPRRRIQFGDAGIAAKPIVNYCSQVCG